ncbi:MAG: hypothetical protein IJW79_04975, partial [Clostridia bacterium]|nr:hypothetical protein [Clostridia bacterium]
MEKSFDKSFLVKKIGKESSKRGVAGKLKRAVAQSFENSRIIGSFSKTLSDMLFGSLKEYGAFFLVL